MGNELDDGCSRRHGWKDNKRGIDGKALNLHIHATLGGIASVIALDVGVTIGCVVLKHGIAACIIIYDGKLLVFVASPVSILQLTRHLQGVCA